MLYDKNCNTMTQPKKSGDKEFIFYNKIRECSIASILWINRRLDAAQELLAALVQPCQATKNSCGEVL